MSTEILYHGTNGDNILAILKTGEMTPKGGEIFFGRYRWASLFMHGGDRKRRANFVIKVRAEIPDTAVREYIATQGVGDTLRVRTTQPLRVHVLELYVRKPAEDGFEMHHITGIEVIKAFLS